MVTVRVPATSANLGPGFDCLALALDLWNEVEFEQPASGGSGLSLRVEGEGAGFLPGGASNLVARAAQRLFREAGQPPPPRLRILCRNRIPAGSGLGSSSAGIVSGLAGANALLGFPFDNQRLLTLAAEMEGHPDNSAAAVLGGLVIVAAIQSELVVRKVEIPILPVVVVLPDFHFGTRFARAALPAQVAHRDAVFNLGRAALVVEALRTRDLALLGKVMEDRLHQPYRLKLIPGAAEALEAARQAGAAAAALSGAGASVIAFEPGDPDAVGSAMQAAFARAGLKSRIWRLESTNRALEVV
jgi:homoserine kinase